jgi:hypothetical protein
VASSLSLTGQRVLVVEDEPLIAMDIVQAVEDVGGEVVGPAATVTDARELARSGGVYRRPPRAAT